MDIESQIGGEILIDQLHFKPVYQIAEWREDQNRENRKLSIVIMLYCGSGQEMDFYFKVIDGGNSLTYSFK